MRYIVNNEEKNITLKVWKNGQYSPDCFADIDTEWHDLWSSEDGACIVTAEHYAEIVEWWEDEIKHANDPESYSEVFDNWDVEVGGELVLFAD